MVTKVDRVKLSYKSFDEINAVREAIESDPKNLMPEGGFHKYKPAARKKLDDIAWAVTNKMERERQVATPKAPVAPEVRQPWQMTKVEFAEEGDRPSRSITEYIRTLTTRARYADEVDSLRLQNLVRRLKDLQGKEDRAKTRVQKDSVTALRTSLLQEAEAEQTHKGRVQNALREGKPVPAEVLKDYPDLKRQAEVEAKKQFEKKWQKAYGDRPETIDIKKPVTPEVTQEKRIVNNTPLVKIGENWFTEEGLRGVKLELVGKPQPDTLTKLISKTDSPESLIKQIQGLPADERRKIMEWLESNQAVNRISSKDGRGWFYAASEVWKGRAAAPQAPATPKPKAEKPKEPWEMTREELETELASLDAKNKAEIERLNRIDPNRQQFGTIELSASEINRMGDLASALEVTIRKEAEPAIARIQRRKELARTRQPVSPEPEVAVPEVKDVVPSRTIDVGGRRDTWTGGFAIADPAVNRLKSLGYEAELVKTDRPRLAGRFMGSIYSIKTNAPDAVVKDAKAWQYTPEGQRAKMDRAMVEAGIIPTVVAEEITAKPSVVKEGKPIAELQRIHTKRSPLSRASDERQKHQVTISPDSPRVKSWISDPGRADISGIDTPRLGSKSPRITPKTPKLRR